MSRRSHSLRISSTQPSYYSRLSRGVVVPSSFERRFIPGAIGTGDETAVIIPFERPIDLAANSTPLPAEDRARGNCEETVSLRSLAENA